jgi:hypothetical protein
VVQANSIATSVNVGAGSLSVTGATTIGSTLVVTGFVTGGTYNGQTISGAANLTGSLTIAGNTITGGTINGQTLGASSVLQNLNLQGSSGLTLGVADITEGQLNFANNLNSNISSLSASAPSGSGVADYLLPSINGGATDTVCLQILANCAGSGGDVIGTGTTNYVARFTTSNTLGTGALYDDGTNVGIGTTGGAYRLTVNGAIGATSIYQNGYQVCDTSANCSYAPVSGSTSYVNNGVATQQANFNIQSLTTTSPTAILQAASYQTSDLLDLENTSGNVVASIDTAGDLMANNAMFNSNLDVSGTAIVSGTLGVTGSVTLVGGASINGLTVTNGATIGGTITANTVGNTINGLIINSGALSDIASIATSGGYTQTGVSANTFTGTIQGMALVSATQLSAGTSFAGTSYTATVNTSNNPGYIGLGVRASAAQTADLQEFQDVNGIVESSFGSTGQLTLGTIATSGTVYQGQLTLSDGTTDGKSVTLKTVTQANSVALSIPVDTNATDTICLLLLNNCTSSGNTTGTGTANYVARFTSASNLATGKIYDNGSAVSVGGTAPSSGGLFNVGTSNQFQVSSAGAVTAVGLNAGTGLIQGTGSLSVSAGSGVAATVQGAAGQDVADFKTSGGMLTDYIDSAGNFNSYATIIADGSFASNNYFLANGTETNTSAAAAMINDYDVALTGTANTTVNANTLNGVNFQSVTPTTNNTFNALYFGTGYNSLLNYNGTSIISGTGLLQSAGIAGSYTGLTGTGALTAGSIASGFGTISTANNITTTTTLQGTIVNATGSGNAIELGGANINTAGTLSNVAYLNQANTFTGDNTISPTSGTALLVKGYSGQTSTAILNVASSTGASLFSVNGSGVVTAVDGISASGGASCTTVSAALCVNAGTASYEDTIDKAASSQTADLQDFVDANNIVESKFNATGQLTLGTIATSGTVYQGQLTLSDGTTDNYGVTLKTATQANSVVLSIPADTHTTDTVCLQTLANCGGGTIGGSGTASYVARFTGSATLGTGLLYDNGTLVGVGTTSGSYTFNVNGSIGATSLFQNGYQVCDTSGNCSTGGGSGSSGSYINNTTAVQTNANIDIQGTAGTVAAVIKGANGSDIADFYSSSGSKVASIDQYGDLIAGSGSFTGSSATTYSLNALSLTDSNTTSTANTTSAQSVALTGTANTTTNANTLDGVKFNNVTAATNNTFNALYFGTGYNSLLNYNGTSIISGTGLLQSAGIAGSYTGLTGTGALTAGSIASGFGTISTANNITTTTTLQGTIVNATGSGNAIELGGANINTAGTLSNVAYLNQANTFTGDNTISPTSGTALTINGYSGENSTNILSVGTYFSVNGYGNTNELNGASVSGSMSCASGTAALCLISSSTASVAQVVKATSGQTADLQDFVDSNNIVASSFNASGQLTLGTVASSGTAYQGKLSFSDGTTDGKKVTLQTATQANSVTVSLPADTNATDTVCLQTLGNCGGGLATNYIENTTTQEVANFNIAASSGVAATIQGASGQDVTDFKNSSGSVVASINQSGNLTGGTGTFSNAGAYANGYALDVNQTNTNTSSTAYTENGAVVALTGTANTTTGANILDGIDFNNVTAATNNTFNALYFGTGYNSLLNYNGTSIISGTGLLQSAGLSGAYTNLTGTGALTTGSISTGFGVISTGNNISTTAQVQGNTLAVTTTSIFSGQLTANGGITANQITSAAINLGSGGAVTATASTSGAYFSDAAVGDTVLRAANSQILRLGVNNSGGTATSTVQISSTGLTTAGLLVNGAASLTSTLNVQGATKLGVAGSSTGQLIFANAGTSNLVTLQDSNSQANATTLSIPTDTNATDTVCLLTLNNCNTSGTTQGTGTTNYVARFTGTSTLGTGLLYDNGSLVGVGTTTGSYALNVNGSAGATTLYQNGQQVCDVSNNCSDETTATTDFIRNQTAQQSGTNFNIAANSGVAATIQGSAGSDIVDFLTSGVSNAFKIDQNGNVTATGSTTTTLTSTTNNGSALITKIINNNTSSTTISENGLTLQLSGSANSSGNNITNAIKLSNVVGATGNIFDGVSFGTGYNALLSYNGSTLLDGSGLLQNSALSSAIQYTNISGVGALTSGSIATGFGAINTTNSITTSATLSGSVITATNYYQIAGTTILQTPGTANTFVGQLVGNSSISGSNDTGSGYDSLHAISGGSYDTATGSNSLTSLTTGSNDSAFGDAGLQALTGGSYDTSTGVSALHSLQGASYDTALGDNSGYSDVSGANDTFVGYGSGYNTTGTGDVFLGYEAGYNETGNNKLYIANSSTSTPLIYGDFSASSLTFNGSITTTSSTNLQGATTLGVASSTTGLLNFSNSANSNLVTLEDSAGQSNATILSIPVDANSTDSICLQTLNNCGSGVTSIGTFDGGTASANGASVSGGTLYLQSATSTDAGLITTTSQTIAGAKTFTGNTTIDGSVKLQDSTNSTTALLVQNASANPVLDVDTTDGRVGIGTTTPNNALSVVGNIAASGTITGGIGSPDYAEEIPATDQTIDAGDVVTMDPDNPGSVIKANTPYDMAVMGVISTHPGFITNADAATVAGGTSDASERPLALSGRVPVKVSDMNGAIEPGDYLTTSSIPGLAMKATEAGAVIGKAMTAFTGADGSTCSDNTSYMCGTVTVFIDNTQYDPSTAADEVMQGGDATLDTLSINGALSAASINVGGMATMHELMVIGDASVGGNLSIGGTLSVSGSTSVVDLSISGHLITTGSAPTVASSSAAGTGATVMVTGDDTAGTITVTTGSNPSAGSMANVSFTKAYAALPHVLLTPNDSKSAPLIVYPDQQTTTGFSLSLTTTPAANTSYTFEYFVVE